MSGRQVGHFGSLVIGEEAAAEEAKIKEVGAHHFGELVVGKVHAHGKLVTDAALEQQLRAASGLDPGKIWALNVPEARKLIERSGSVKELAAWRAVEEINPDHDGGRKGVLGAIDSRLEELQAGQEDDAVDVAADLEDDDPLAEALAELADEDSEEE